MASVPTLISTILLYPLSPFDHRGNATKRNPFGLHAKPTVKMKWIRQKHFIANNKTFFYSELFLSDIDNFLRTFILIISLFIIINVWYACLLGWLANHYCRCPLKHICVSSTCTEPTCGLHCNYIMQILVKISGRKHIIRHDQLVNNGQYAQIHNFDASTITGSFWIVLSSQFQSQHLGQPMFWLSDNSKMCYTQDFFQQGTISIIIIITKDLCLFYWYFTVLKYILH